MIESQPRRIALREDRHGPASRLQAFALAQHGPALCMGLQMPGAGNVRLRGGLRLVAMREQLQILRCEGVITLFLPLIRPSPSRRPSRGVAAYPAPGKPLPCARPGSGHARVGSGSKYPEIKILCSSLRVWIRASAAWHPRCS